MKSSLNRLWHLALALIFAFTPALPMPGGLSTMTAFAATGPLCYVDANASGAHNGNSWTDAYTTVQDALADANCAEIWVTAGVYYPDEGSGQTNDNRASTFQLKNSTALYGGFDGTETARDQRDPAANVTVLSGDIDKDDTTDANGVVTDTANINGNNAYHVVTGSGTDNTAVLDGFTITAGHADESFPDDVGGGMYNDSGSPALTNVTFSANSADVDGGGMYNIHSSSPTLTNVTFAHNSAAVDGGGIFNMYSSSPTLMDVTFSANSASYVGGGMHNVYSSSPTLMNVTFSGNSAFLRGGGMDSYYSNPTLTNVTFSHNSVSFYGGGMSNYYGSPTLINVTFSDNSASNSGGGMYNQSQSNPTLTNVIIANSASGGDCVNDFNSSIASGSANNLIEDSAHACGLTNGANGNIIGSDPALGALTDFGGTGKQVFPLLTGSPAIDTGTNCPATDQRGVTRPVGAACDIGAYEYATPPVVASHSLQASYTGSGPNSFTVTFSKAVADPAGNSGQDDVTNPANYLLIEKGGNGAADTASCAGGVAGDDVQQTVTTVAYNGTTYTSTVTLAGALPIGNYRLFVCGTTSIVDTANNPLNNGLSDATFDFTVQSRAASLPETGFPMGRVTTLPEQPPAKAYTDSAMTLEIPKLGVSMPIVGVPASTDGWNVTWLGDAAGWLEGSAFPTWAGNTVITGHVWDAYNQPGPFAELKTLHYGDTIEIYAWGQVYTYEVRESKVFWSRTASSRVFRHEETDVLTLLTCEGYNPFTGNYFFRRAVRAVLVDVR